MKKNNKINIGLFLIAIAITAYVSTRDFGGSTIEERAEDYDFVVEDTAAVTKIIISDKQPSDVELTRTSEGWIVDGDFAARPDAIEVLLETLHRMRLRNFPQKEAIPTILSRMGTYGKEVKVYKGEELIQHFIVGTDNPDQLGTYMMKVDGDQPYAVFIPGFNGYLSSRFFTRKDLWRDRTIFGTDNLDVRKVEMEYGIVPQEGFSILQNDNGELTVQDWNGASIEPFDAQHTRFFLGSLRTLKYEGMIVESDEVWAKQDSIRNSIPVFELSVTDKDGETKTLSAYHVPPEPDTFDDDGNPRRFDPDRFYAFTGDGRFVLVQTYGLENVLKTHEYFRR